MGQRLVVKIATGADQHERLTTGLTVAAAAVAAGVEVSLWLAGDAVRLALPGGEAVGAAADDAEARDLLDAVREAAVISVCARCARRRGIQPEDLLPGFAIAGAAAFVAQVMAPDARALVY